MLGWICFITTQLYNTDLSKCENQVKWLYVTGYWKTDQIVTLGLFHFIGPADSYTHTLPMH